MTSKADFLKLMGAVFDRVDINDDGIVDPEEVLRSAGKLSGEKERKMFSGLFRFMAERIGERVAKKGFLKYADNLYDAKGAPPPDALAVLRKIATMSDADKALKQSLKSSKDAAVQELKAMFDRYDTDASGTLDLKELKFFAAQMRAPMSDTELKSALADMDKSKTGAVCFDDLYKWWKSHERTTKSTGALAKLYLGAAQEYLSNEVKQFFKKKQADRATRMVDTKFGISIGNVDAKNAGGRLVIEGFKPGEGEFKSEAEAFALRVQFTYTNESKATALVTIMQGALAALNSDGSIPPELKLAAQTVNVALDRDAHTVTIDMRLPNFGGAPDPFALLPTKPGSFLKSIRLELLTKVNGLSGLNAEGTTVLNAAEFALSVAATYDKGRIAPIIAGLAQGRGTSQRRGRFRRRRSKPAIGILMFQAALNGAVGELRFASPSEVVELLGEAGQGILPPPQLLSQATREIITGFVNGPYRAMARQGMAMGQQMRAAPGAAGAIASYAQTFFQSINGLGSLTSARVATKAGNFGVQLTASPGFLDLGVLPDASN